jgi:Xaa-Pro aminopeptidase
VYPSSPKQVIDAAGTAAFLVSNLTNIRYLTDVDMSAGFLLITPRRITLFADSRYSEEAAKNVRKGIAVQPCKQLQNSLAKVQSCGCESDVVTLAQLGRWKRKFKNTKFVQKEGIIEEFRRTKEPAELRKFRRAQSMTQQVLRKVPRELKEGISEKQLARKLRDFAEKLGADSLSFDPIVAFGTHTSRPHHHPTDRKLQKGHLVQIDMGARYKGYCADQSAVFFTGPKTSKQERAYRAVTEAKSAATALVRDGVSTHDLDSAARAVLREYGYEKSFMHSLGHGVGLDIHEGVTLSVRAPELFLRKGEIVTIEPGVYFEGQFGIRLEDELIVQ